MTTPDDVVSQVAMGAMVVVGIAIIAVAWARWARVAQREHYHPRSLTRIARLWMRTRRVNRLLAVALVIAIVLIVIGVTIEHPTPTLVGSLMALGATAVFPWRLPQRGRDRPLAWTRRLCTLSAVAALLSATLGAALFAVSVPVWAVPAAIAVVLVAIGEAALMLTVPLEDRLAGRHQRRAEQRLRRVDPTVIAVTGSWGKTTTKNHIRQLIGDTTTAAISPASFNNRGGLSRTMNEHLADGTEVLVVEMGMYGPGEIRAMCEWVQPEVGVITAIGPMHLERVGSIEGIIAAKSEIIERTTCAVLWVAQPELARVAADSESLRPNQRIIRCGTSTADDVCVVSDDDAHRILIAGREVGRIETSPGLHPANIGCAVGALIAIGFETEAIVRHLGSLHAPDHRATVQTTPSGVVVIDDTFNSNPVGARRAIERLSALGSGRRVVVSPGMMELGDVQFRENLEFARFAAQRGVDVIVVGHTNRDALLAGAREAGHPALWVPSREAARSMLATDLRSGDAVLWENDLPDHYP